MVVPLLSYNTNNNIYEDLISWSYWLNLHIWNNILQKYFMFTKIFYQTKQNYTKNEHFIQQWSVFGLFGRNFDFWISYLLQVYGTAYFLTHLFLIIVPSMLKATLKKFPATQFFILFYVLNFNKTAIYL